MNVNLLVVGIGNSVKTDHLSQLSGGKNWYYAKSFDELKGQKFISKMNRAGCDIVSTKKSCQTKKKVDICFLIDSSGSIKPDSFKQLIEFVSRLADK